MLIQVLCCGRTVEKEGQFWKRSQVSRGAIEKVVLKSTCLSIRYTVLMHSLQQLVTVVTITFCFNLYAWHNDFVVVSGSETGNMDLPTKDNMTSTAHQCFTKSQDLGTTDNNKIQYQSGQSSKYLLKSIALLQSLHKDVNSMWIWFVVYEIISVQYDYYVRVLRTGNKTYFGIKT